MPVNTSEMKYNVSPKKKWAMGVCVFTFLAMPMSGHAEPGKEVSQGASFELSVGTKGGFGWTNYGGGDADTQFANTEPKLGNSYGLVLSTILHPRFGLQLEFLRMAKGSAVETPDGMDVGTLEMNYLGGALLGDINITTGRMLHPYIVGGVWLGYLLDSTRVYPDNRQDLTAGTTTLDVGVIAGAGIGWRLAPKHEITFETRVDIGLRTTDSSEGNDNELLNRSLMFMLGYRFWVLSGSSQKPTDSGEDEVPDSRDKCPKEAEDKDGFEDEDGCLDTDNDGDKIVDSDDQCRDEAEDVDGFEDKDGCPEADKDSDGDGVGDSKDVCQGQSEDKNKFKDDDGCPDGEEDSDKDLVKDFEDKCLDKPGLWTADGCAREYQHIAVEKERIVFKQDARVVFVASAQGRNAVRDKLSDESLAVLDDIAKALDEHPGIKLRINAHTDDRGNNKKNIELSQKQAEMVRDALVERGVAAERLEAKGHGKARTLGRDQEKNRRIELEIVQVANE